MAGETDLGKLLAGMAPLLHEGQYVFCAVGEMPPLPLSSIVCFFREEEAWTLVLEKGMADCLLPDETLEGCGPPMAWITLMVHSSLEAVGLTAAVAAALAARGISCNVVAAYYHDHIFVGYGDAAAALDVLRGLSEGRG